VARANTAVLRVKERLECRHNGPLLCELLPGELLWHAVGLYELRIDLTASAQLALGTPQLQCERNRLLH
jgi:hypothetical protein